MKATVGYKIWARMSQGEQEKFFDDIGRDKIKTLIQKATQQYIDENRKLMSVFGTCKIIKDTVKIIDIIKPIYNFKSN